MLELGNFDEDNKAELFDLTRKPIGVEIIKKYIINNNCQIILDLGCGTGNFMKVIDETHSNLQLIGIDKSIKMLKLCCSKLNPDKTSDQYKNMLITDNGNTIELINKEIYDKTPIFHTPDLIYSYQVLQYL